MRFNLGFVAGMTAWLCVILCGITVGLYVVAVNTGEIFGAALLAADAVGFAGFFVLNYGIWWRNR